METLRFKSILILAIFSIATACSSKKKVAEKEDEIDMENMILIDQIIQTNLSPAFYSAKGKGRFNGMGVNQGFKIEIRSIRDSILWIDVSAALFGIKVARLMATPDSVHFYNRLEKSYLQSSITDLQKLVKGPVNFYDLQALINGQPIGSLGKGTKLENREGQWIHLNNSPSREVLLRFDAGTFQLLAQGISYPLEKQSVQASYRKDSESIPLPKEINLSTVYKNDDIRLSINLDEVNSESPPHFPFSIPSGYKPM
ncbi:MAG: DUF4292 domain-containing protein [Cryomorphaceae bacterium]|nr:DUF4292 domain-containing protein [Cryomorphaceae bacterium]